MAHILIVDDEPDGADAVRTFLRQVGHRADRVPGGVETMRWLLSATPDVLVLDVRMPGVDGITLLEVIRSHVQWSVVPAIILSAHVTPDDAARARGMGVRHILHKARATLGEIGAAVADAAAAGHPAGAGAR